MLSSGVQVCPSLLFIFVLTTGNNDQRQPPPMTARNTNDDTTWTTIATTTRATTQSALFEKLDMRRDLHQRQQAVRKGFPCQGCSDKYTGLGATPLTFIPTSCRELQCRSAVGRDLSSISRCLQQQLDSSTFLTARSSPSHIC